MGSGLLETVSKAFTGFVHERLSVEMFLTKTDNETTDISSTASAATVVPTVCNGREVVDSTTSSL